MPSNDAADTILALDVGERRLGVAISHNAVRVALPWGTIDRQSTDVWAELARIVTERRVKAIVVGLPRNQSGEETAQSAQVRNFVDDLKQRIEVLYFFQDESLTSRKAEEYLQLQKQPYTKDAIDALAAQLILDDFLSAHPEGV